MLKKCFTLLALSFALTSCGTLGGGMGQTSTSANSQQQGQGAASSLPKNNADQATSIIGSVLGQLLGGLTTNQTSIIGTWTYAEPAVQFESENLLAKAGGAVASKKIADEINPYFKKIGITPGKFVLTLNEDKTCSFTLGGRTYTGTYTFDPKAGTIQVKSMLFSLPTAYITVVGSQMALTFDASKMMDIARTIGTLTGNSTVSALASILNNYEGMKAGFLFKK